MINLMHGDCLELMREIPDGSVDMVLCDLPYGTTACKWDSVIPFEPLWEQYQRIAKRNAAIVLTAAQPFTSALIMSNVKMFKYDWVWLKAPSGNLNAKRMPMAGHESVLVFAVDQPAYNPQGLIFRPLSRRATSVSRTENYGSQIPKEYVQEFTGYPNTKLEFAKDRGLHPTQKPVALMEYLIKTYTNPGETVLDNCMGSGTTGVACKNLNRKFIGIEKDDKYFEVAKNRIENHIVTLL